MNKRLLTSCFGLGFAPFAPGTVGSLAPAVIFYLLKIANISLVLISLMMLALAIFGSYICVKFGPEIEEKIGKKDPGEIVADEFAGQSATFIFISFFTVNPILSAVLGFVFFRIFDISKPWLVKKAEKFSKGWGILADDIVAGIFAGLLVSLIYIFDIPKQTAVLFSRNADLNLFSGSVLGIIQGLTEFLPVSSSGHLVLFEHLFAFEPERPEMLIFDLATHVGTVIAILIAFYDQIIEFFKNLYKSIFKGKYGSSPLLIYEKSPSIRFAVLGIFTTLITALVGFTFKETFESARGNLVTVAVCWLITALLLVLADTRKKTRIGLREFGLLAAGIIGIAQAAAIFPGISRSGATICTAILIGLHRKWAVEFSFLLAIPAIIGAALITLLKDYSLLTEGNISAAALLGGTVSAAIVGILAIKLLLLLSRKSQLKYFAIYCVLLSTAVFAYLIYNIA